jgi:predicted amidophosphoribosyltransferase
MTQLAPQLPSGYLWQPLPGPDICRDCFNITARGFDRCFACAATEQRLDAIVPISYCVSHSPLHHDLVDYKLRAEPCVPFLTARLAAVLTRFLALHEQCVAAQAGVARFDLVTTVPSNDRRRDQHHPLRRIVGELVPQLHTRYVRALQRSALELPPRSYNPSRFEACVELNNRSVLLIDDTWTTGSSAQSAAAALKRAGAAAVAAVTIGRYVNGDWQQAANRLIQPDHPFDFSTCIVCAKAHAQAA